MLRVEIALHAQRCEFKHSTCTAKAPHTDCPALISMHTLHKDALNTCQITAYGMQISPRAENLHESVPQLKTVSGTDSNAAGAVSMKFSAKALMRDEFLGRLLKKLHLCTPERGSSLNAYTNIDDPNTLRHHCPEVMFRSSSRSKEILKCVRHAAPIPTVQQTR